MGERDPRIDAYIAKAEPFARPILEHLRALVHATCPDADETIKWGMPFFVSGGASLCHMAAFKQHAAFGFWRQDRKSTRLNSSHSDRSRMPSSA